MCYRQRLFMTAKLTLCLMPWLWQFPTSTAARNQPLSRWPQAISGRPPGSGVPRNGCLGFPVTCPVAPWRGTWIERLKNALGKKRRFFGYTLVLVFWNGVLQNFVELPSLEIFKNELTVSYLFLWRSSASTTRKRKEEITSEGSELPFLFVTVLWSSFNCAHSLNK